MSKKKETIDSNESMQYDALSRPVLDFEDYGIIKIN